MNIQPVGINESLRLYYKSSNLKSGQSVIFNIWDSSGVSLLADTPADGEIGSRGVYFFDITTPNYEDYLLVKGSLTGGTEASVSIYSVGRPLQKLFYVDGSLKTGLTVPYRIFDINADNKAAADLTESAGGFYYADASLIESSLDLFFRAENIAYEFDLIDSSIVFVNGGVLVSGAASELIKYIPITSGGSIVGGNAEELFVPGVGGGILVSGSVVIRYDVYVEVGGGVSVGGHGALIFNVEVGGGVSVGGAPDVEDLFFNRARDKKHLYFIGDGVYLRYEPKGDLPSRYERRTVEGLRFFGERNLYDVGIGILVDESLLISDLNINVVRSDEASDSIDWAKGQSEDLDNITPLADPIGGILTEDIEVISDGGAAETEIAVDASDKIRDIDSLTPISDPVGGSVVVSTETFNPQDDRSAILNRLKALQDAAVLPDPIGGTLTVTSVDSNRFAGVADKALAKLAALQNTTVLPDPTGGDLMISFTEGLTPDNVTSVQRSIKSLEDVVLLPGPSGAYIIVSIDTEGTSEFKSLESDAIDRIKELGIQAAEEALLRTGAGV